MRRLTLSLCLTGTIFALFAASAFAAATRAEYVVQTDQICKDAGKDFKEALKGLKPPPPGDIEEDPNKVIRQLTKFLSRINKSFGKMVNKIAVVAPAPGDELAVTQWIDGLRDYKRLTDKGISALKHKRSRKAIRAFSEGDNALLGAARLVNGYGFKYCPGGEVVTEGF